MDIEQLKTLARNVVETDARGPFGAFRKAYTAFVEYASDTPDILLPQKIVAMIIQAAVSISCNKKNFLHWKTGEVLWLQHDTTSKTVVMEEITEEYCSISVIGHPGDILYVHQPCMLIEFHRSIPLRFQCVSPITKDFPWHFYPEEESPTQGGEHSTQFVKASIDILKHCHNTESDDFSGALGFYIPYIPSSMLFH